MKNRLIVDYWCALFATWCCKTFTIKHAQNLVVQKNLSELRGMQPHPPHPRWIHHCVKQVAECLVPFLSLVWYTHLFLNEK